MKGILTQFEAIAAFLFNLFFNVDSFDKLKIYFWRDNLQKAYSRISPQ